MRHSIFYILYMQKYICSSPEIVRVGLRLFICKNCTWGGRYTTLDRSVYVLGAVKSCFARDDLCAPTDDTAVIVVAALSGVPFPDFFSQRFGLNDSF